MHLILCLLLAFCLSACQTTRSGKTADDCCDVRETKTQAAVPLLTGSNLKLWERVDFGGGGPVEFKENEATIGMGNALSGMRWTKPGLIPRTNYQITYDAMKREGSDFFASLTFPIGTNAATLVVGGWGGGVVGLSSLNGMDASENETMKTLYFETGRWFHIRLRVTTANVEAWIDESKVIDVELADKKISLRAGDIDRTLPFGFSTYQTTGIIKNVQLKSL